MFSQSQILPIEEERRSLFIPGEFIDVDALNNKDLTVKSKRKFQKTKGKLTEGLRVIPSDLPPNKVSDYNEVHEYCHADLRQLISDLEDCRKIQGFEATVLSSANSIYGEDIRGDANSRILFAVSWKISSFQDPQLAADYCYIQIKKAISNSGYQILSEVPYRKGHGFDGLREWIQYTYYKKRNQYPWYLLFLLPFLLFFIPRNSIIEPLVVTAPSSIPLPNSEVVLYVYDVSGSMEKVNSPSTPGKERLNDILKEHIMRRAKEKRPFYTNLYPFSSEAKSILPEIVDINADLGTKQHCIEQMCNHVVCGGTCIEKGLELAIQDLEKFINKKPSIKSATIILITDGEADDEMSLVAESKRLCDNYKSRAFSIPLQLEHVWVKKSESSLSPSYIPKLLGIFNTPLLKKKRIIPWIQTPGNTQMVLSPKAKQYFDKNNIDITWDCSH